MKCGWARNIIEDGDADEGISFFEGQCLIRVANCFELRHRVYRFQHQAYEKSGIVEPVKDGLWVTLHDALPETTTLIAEDRHGNLAGALTIVFDSPIGLPADSLFPAEMNSIRKTDSRICELISFGTSETMRASVKILAGLLYSSYLFALHARKATDFVITVHERYERFYCSNLLFSRKGPVRSYEKVNNEPTVLLQLPLKLPDKLRQNRRIFPLSLFHYSKPQEQAIASMIDLIATPMSPQEFIFFYSEKNDIWNKATPEQMGFIQSIYASDR